METFSALLAICGGIHRPPVNSPHKGQWRGALVFSLICVWINGWVNNREAGDLSRFSAHYDVTIMVLIWHKHHDCRLQSQESGHQQPCDWSRLIQLFWTIPESILCDTNRVILFAEHNEMVRYKLIFMYIDTRIDHHSTAKHMPMSFYIR